MSLILGISSQFDFIKSTSDSYYWPTFWRGIGIRQNGLATKVEKSRKQVKERKNRAKKIRGVKKVALPFHIFLAHYFIFCGVAYASGCLHVVAARCSDEGRRRRQGWEEEINRASPCMFLIKNHSSLGSDDAHSLGYIFPGPVQFSWPPVEVTSLSHSLSLSEDFVGPWLIKNVQFFTATWFHFSALIGHMEWSIRLLSCLITWRFWLSLWGPGRSGPRVGLFHSPFNGFFFPVLAKEGWALESPVHARPVIHWAKACVPGFSLIHPSGLVKPGTSNVI